MIACGIPGIQGEELRRKRVLVHWRSFENFESIEVCFLIMSRKKIRQMT